MITINAIIYSHNRRLGVEREKNNEIPNKFGKFNSVNKKLAQKKKQVRFDDPFRTESGDKLKRRKREILFLLSFSSASSYFCSYKGKAPTPGSLYLSLPLNIARIFSVPEPIDLILGTIFLSLLLSHTLR